MSLARFINAKNGEIRKYEKTVLENGNILIKILDNGEYRKMNGIELINFETEMNMFLLNKYILLRKKCDVIAQEGIHLASIL